MKADTAYTVCLGSTPKWQATFAAGARHIGGCQTMKQNPDAQPEIRRRPDNQ